MNKLNNTENPGFWDYMIPGGLLLISYIFIYSLPQELTLKGWIVFGLSVFLFCVGYFGFLTTLPEPKTLTGAIIRRLVLVTVAILMFLIGLYYVYIDNGSEKSLAIAVLFLIEGIVMSGFGDNNNSGILLQNKLMNYVYLALIAGMAIAGCWFFYLECFSEAVDSKGRVEVATMLWIAAGALWKSRNSFMDSDREAVSKTNRKQDRKTNNPVEP